MSKLLNIQEEICECPYCEATDVAVGEILDVENVEELHEIVADLVAEVRSLSYKEALIADIEAKIDIVKAIESESDSCNCDECTCEA